LSDLASNRLLRAATEGRPETRKVVHVSHSGTAFFHAER
jgi:hypothetical protein